jgi:hypothetical protein
VVALFYKVEKCRSNGILGGILKTEAEERGLRARTDVKRRDLAGIGRSVLRPYKGLRNLLADLTDTGGASPYTDHGTSPAPTTGYRPDTHLGDSALQRDGRLAKVQTMVLD